MWGENEMKKVILYISVLFVLLNCLAGVIKSGSDRVKPHFGYIEEKNGCVYTVNIDGELYDFIYGKYDFDLGDEVVVRFCEESIVEVFKEA